MNITDGNAKVKKLIRELSDRIVVAQRPIQILDAIKWDDETKQHFFKNQFKKLPNITKDFYLKQPLPYDPQNKIAEFHEIIRDINRLLGSSTGIGKIMIRTCDEYLKAVEMIQARGTKKFSEIAVELYGSPEDAFYPAGPKLKDLSTLLADTLIELKGKVSTESDIKRYTAAEAVNILRAKLGSYFHLHPTIKIMVSDNIYADASAGADSIKLNSETMFSDRDIRVLEVHEGWVHLATTLNGLAQPYCTFLGKGSPSSAITQEGLAVLTEVVTFSSSPERVQKLTNRLKSIDMVNQGANFIDVFNYFHELGLSEDDSYKYTLRVFRGSLPEGGGPFTKDLTYSKGFILIYNYIRLTIKHGLLKHIPLLFSGKTILDEITTLTDLMEEGFVAAPLYLPPQFRDIAALSAWMCFSLFLNKVNIEKIAIHYKQIFGIC